MPKAVRDELFKRCDTKKRVKALLNAYAFVERCDGYDRGSVDLLLIERTAQGVKDRGEAEAVVQASELGATVVVDDRWGRDLAIRFGRDCHGTFWVLQRLFQLGLVSSAATRSDFEVLVRRGVRLPRELVDEFLLELGELPLT